MRFNKTKVFCLMAEKGLGRRQLAEDAGLSYDTTTKAIKGGKITALTAGKIAKALGVHVADLIEEEREDESK